MATVTRTTTWNSGDTLTASLLNGEFNNLLNALALGNSDIAGGAAIAYSKLSLTGSITNADLAGSIASSKISGTAATLTGSETLTNKTLTSPVLNTGVSGTAVLDEDTMTSNSATQLATQQSIKAYVDSSGVPKRCQAAILVTPQSISHNAAEAVLWNSEVYDTDTMFTATSQTITIKTAGVYYVGCNVTWAANSTEARQLQLYHGGTIKGLVCQMNIGASRNTSQYCAYVDVFSVNDTVSAEVVQWSGGNLNLNSGVIDVIRLGSAT